MDNNVDDKALSLYELSLRHQASIVSQLVKIGSERNQQKHIKPLSFIHRLQCLEPRGQDFYRKSINATKERQYVALSYTWEPSEFEDQKSGQYRVENWDDSGLASSNVRDDILNRILSYMHHEHVQLLWIDAHCIRQDTCIAPCTRHNQCTQKRDALQAMDLVYQNSEHPTALLGRPLRTKSELDLLASILSQKFVDGDSDFRLSNAATARIASNALLLLHRITQDSWWGRAWTFQENYRGGQQMRLLIRHDSLLEQHKPRLFGDVPGELCVESIAFSREATRFCLALRQTRSSLANNSRIDDVLRAAGRYKVMLDVSSAMTPLVFADIEARGLTQPWDRLAILSNCCQYSMRLHSEVLSEHSCSLSLSALATCLLNGEILDNNDNNSKTAAHLTTSNFLRQHMFKSFSAPEDNAQQLTFYKGCRLTDVKITAEGVSTKGHLWKLSHPIDTSKFYSKQAYIENPHGRLTLSQRRYLQRLVWYLSEKGYDVIASQIDDYLATDSNSGEDYDSFTEMYLHHMAIELAAAIEAGLKLRLGCIWDPTGAHSPYRAIFMWPEEEENKGAENQQPVFVFTSTRVRKRPKANDDPHDTNDIDRHVSLEVRLDERPIADVPHLRVCRWLLGMCFFKNIPRTDVVFPWPRALQEVHL